MASPTDKRRGPGGRSGPGRGSSAPSGRVQRTTSPAARTGPVAAAPRPRFTGRAAILVLVLAVLAVSYASSLRAYLQQRAHISDLQNTISERQGEISALEREKKRWSDDEYVRAQARERLGYVLPGETPFVALRDGQPLEPESALTDPSTIADGDERAWWDHAWQSVVVAGDPPTKVDPQPLTRITDPEGAPDEGSEE